MGGFGEILGSKQTADVSSLRQRKEIEDTILHLCRLRRNGQEELCTEASPSFINSVYFLSVMNGHSECATDH